MFFRKLSRAISFKPKRSTRASRNHSARPCHLKVTVGQLFEGRYTILGKLGQGSYATVWLARDDAAKTESTKQVAIKILTAECTTGPESLDELGSFLSARSHGNSGDGNERVVKLLGYFHYRGHACLVLELLGESVDDVRGIIGSRRLPAQVVKKLCRDMLLALDYLHNSGVIHTDIHPSNILLAQPLSRPTPPKEELERVLIERASHVAEPMFKLADLGHAVPTETVHHGLIQPAELRAPEVIIEASWDEKVDIWNMGCLAYEFVTGGRLFNPNYQTVERGIEPAEAHLVQIIEQIGDFDEDLLRRGIYGEKYFDFAGDLRCNAPLCRTTMEEIMTRVQKKLGVMDLAELTVFCDFLRTMLRIRPEERWPPSLILEHHWLEVD
ncbi:kinase-like protein [Armillaria gallica]|uniref:Kinase-like protein n=1 Tax=Armillaria gallica TaxID=47427 RepID=A0A2H3E7B5_ARMGA|nr:kinase-like protein [Armillaria gallica]